MTTETSTATAPQQDKTVEEKLSQLRELFADAPEIGKTALERVLTDRLGGNVPCAPVTVDLDDIQAAVLRYRPEPYYGTHVMLHIDDAQAGRELVRRLTPHVDSAAGWWQGGHSWISVALSRRGPARDADPHGRAVLPHGRPAPAGSVLLDGRDEGQCLLVRGRPDEHLVEHDFV